ncbi:hypothetical protein SAY87_030556 [Trapa incisa]|uniref:Uncharacterized protein n=1 Tax=Trapa incisa TaxID=236973 RepID=A0AAN7KRZ1_9MYRT|nr:hypothetical protein SAY87_030556 [Trapa incisa]
MTKLSAMVVVFGLLVLLLSEASSTLAESVAPGGSHPTSNSNQKTKQGYVQGTTAGNAAAEVVEVINNAGPYVGVKASPQPAPAATSSDVTNVTPDIETEVVVLGH